MEQNYNLINQNNANFCENSIPLSFNSTRQMITKNKKSTDTGSIISNIIDVIHSTYDFICLNEDDFIKFGIKPNDKLSFNVFKSNKYYISEDEHFEMYCIAESREELKNLMIESFVFNWNFYVKKDNHELTNKAIKLKAKMMCNFEAIDES